jgi:hypothetical protein
MVEGGLPIKASQPTLWATCTSSSLEISLEATLVVSSLSAPESSSPCGQKHNYSRPWLWLGLHGRPTVCNHARPCWSRTGVQRGNVVTQVHAGAARASDENLWSTLTYELQAEGSKIPFGSRSQRPSVHVRTGHAGAARASENLWSRTSTLEPHGRPRVCGHARPRRSRTGVRESVVTHVHAGAARASESLWSRTSTLKPHGCPRVCGHARPRRSRTGVRESVVTHAHAGAARASESLWSRASTPVTPGAARRSGKASPAPALPAARASAAYPGQG